MTKHPNRIKCRYCDWTTYRFKGKKHGEGLLREHILAAHEDEWLRNQGLVDINEDAYCLPDYDDDEEEG